jgi:hypothetical protein
MKRTWRVIEQQMAATGSSARQMALRLRLDPSQLSRMRSGELRDLSGEVLGRLLTGLSDSEEVRAELLSAYLADKLSAPDVPEPLLRRAAQSFKAEDVPPEYRSEAERLDRHDPMILDPRLASALRSLGAAARSSRRLRTILLSLASYVRG